MLKNLQVEGNYTGGFDWTEVQAHFFDGKVYLEGSYLFTQNQQMFDVEQMRV